MLKITNLLGQSLELNPNTVIPVERNNSLFSTDDSFAHDITYPGQAGLTENNKIFIKNGHLVEAKNDSYELPVQVFVADYQFYKAIFTYKIAKDQIEYILKVNFGAVVAKMKTAILQDIYTLDAIPVAAPAGSMQALMKDTCQNPQNYPCAFFPVKNESWNQNATAETTKWLNEWDHTNQKFRADTPAEIITNIGIAPFYKLSYILKKIFDYLKLNVSGNYAASAEFQEIYIYTRKSVLLYHLEPSMMYMPRININDFLKQIKDRLKISFDFDLMTNTVVIETPETALSSECIDITPYIESIEEIATAEQKGYTVTLKVDESDEQANIGTIDNPIYEPPYRLIIGNGENKVELAIGALNQVDETEYSYPVAKQVFDNNFETGEIDDWQVRLIRFKGMKAVSGGKVFPEATSMNLTAKDAAFYRFMNDSKKVIINAKIPPSIVAMMKPTIKLGCKSDKGMFFYALPEKNSYSMSNRTTERIAVKINARTMVSDYNTKFFIDDNKPGDIENPTVWKYKAFWQPEIHGFTQISVKAIPLGGTPDTFGFTPIDQPTDDGGIGGTIGTVYIINAGPSATRNYEMRVYSPIAPAYWVKDGVQGTFTNMGAYYVFNGSALPTYFGRPVWIVF